MTAPTEHWFQRLLGNSRFWILASSVVMSATIAGLVQFMVPSGSLQTIRIEQTFGFVAVGFLLVALFASPISKAYPKWRYKELYLHLRRALGVSAFYYAFLHVCVAFFAQLGGFDGTQYYSPKYVWSLLLGLLGLFILFLMTATSLDWAIKVMTFPRWKQLHRFIYLAAMAILVHILLIGSHFEELTVLSLLIGIAVVLLLRFELLRILYQKGRT